MAGREITGGDFLDGRRQRRAARQAAALAESGRGPFAYRSSRGPVATRRPGGAGWQRVGITRNAPARNEPMSLHV